MTEYAMIRTLIAASRRQEVSFEVKSKFCDLICTGGSKALMDTILAPSLGICTWNKALVKGKGKCTVRFEIVKAG